MENGIWKKIRIQGQVFKGLKSLFNFEGANLQKAREGNPERKPSYGGVAQLGERLPCKQEASGSIPLISTSVGKMEAKAPFESV